jgi:tetratricopeptide (TPR) repeat protein
MIMTELTYTTLTMPAAPLGKDSPLPDLKSAGDAHAAIPIDPETITPEEARYMGYARVNGILPYTVQDGYGRKRAPRAFKAAVLKNDFLRATFLPQLGGRLWSLIDLTTGRELLHRNPVFQPCNLALRNAWISGGVEWNCGVIGHTPYTVSSMYTESFELPDGTPVLRMYQYERVRGLVYRVEAMLPEAGRQLIVHARIDNAGEKDTAVYWWSNMAVDETEDTRVIVPAQNAYRWGYGKQMSKVPVPHYGELDASRPGTLPQAMDFFFDIPDGQRRWIAAVGGDGYGLMQTSTDNLQGRKLFVWGQGAGGRQWQTFLSEKGSAYLEIQAGLAHTQLEHLPMEPLGRREWTEAYGAVQLDPALARGDDWDALTRAAEAALEANCPRAKLAALDASLRGLLPSGRGKPFQSGEGWAHLEKALRGGAFHAHGLRFPAASASGQKSHWLRLISEGALPPADPRTPPTAYQVGDDWLARLSASALEDKGNHWRTHYHLGVMYAYRGDAERARAAYEKSAALTENPWAARGLALLDAKAGDARAAAGHMLEALHLAGGTPPKQLVIEALQALLDAGQYAEAEAAIANLPPAHRKLGRVRVARACALMELGELSRAEKILRGGLTLTDIREGELKLSELWAKLCEKKGVSVEDCPLPPHLDFRMQS